MLFGLFESARDRRHLQLMEQMNETLKRIDQKLDPQTVAELKKRYGNSRNDGNSQKKAKGDWRRQREENRRIERHYQNKFKD